MPGSNNEKLLCCSFCGKSQHDVSKLIYGPGVFICDECVALCNETIDKDASEVKSPLAEIKACMESLCSVLDMARLNIDLILEREHSRLDMDEIALPRSSRRTVL